MPSTLVHAALAGAFGAAILGRAFTARVAVLFIALMIVIDLDALVGLIVQGGHRAAFHTLLIPLGAGAVLLIDRWTGRLGITARVGRRGALVAWTGVFVYLVAGIGPDLFTNGVNLFYPLHDQFYRLDGRIDLSTTQGLVQTFVDLSPPAADADGDSGSVAVGSSAEVHYATGVDPAPDPGPDGNVERVFRLVGSGFQLLLIVAGTTVTGARLWRNHRGADDRA